jgi:fructose-specific phosphotransferase system IIC component
MTLRKRFILFTVSMVLLCFGSAYVFSLIKGETNFIKSFSQLGKAALVLLVPIMMGMRAFSQKNRQ